MWCLRDDEVELVGRGEVADAGVGDGRGLVRRHHVVPRPHLHPSDAGAGEERGGEGGERTGGGERCGGVGERYAGRAAGCLVMVEVGRGLSLPGPGLELDVCISFLYDMSPVGNSFSKKTIGIFPVTH